MKYDYKLIENRSIIISSAKIERLHKMLYMVSANINFHNNVLENGINFVDLAHKLKKY